MRILIALCLFGVALGKHSAEVIDRGFMDCLAGSELEGKLSNAVNQCSSFATGRQLNSFPTCDEIASLMGVNDPSTICAPVMQCIFPAKRQAGWWPTCQDIQQCMMSFIPAKRNAVGPLPTCQQIDDFVAQYMPRQLKVNYYPTCEELASYVGINDPTSLCSAVMECIVPRKRQMDWMPKCEDVQQCLMSYMPRKRNAMETLPTCQQIKDFIAQYMPRQLKVNYYPTCEELASYVGINDPTSLCSAVMECIVPRKRQMDWMPKCEDVQQCLMSYMPRKRNAVETLPTCQQINDFVAQYMPRQLNMPLLKRQGNACPSFQEIVDALSEDYEDDVCVLSNLGWVNNDFTWNNETISADISSLPTEVTAGLVDLDACVNDSLNEFMGHECIINMDETSVSMLSDIYVKVAQYECFKSIIRSGCDSNMSG